MSDTNPTPYQPNNILASLAEPAPSPEVMPEQIGRYRVESLLGEGSFGRVYLAYDQQLQRQVAIKVPHTRHIVHLVDVDVYLKEARTVARLDHPHIVPVFDVGSSDGFPFFIVSKYIDGTDLATRLKQSRLEFDRALELVAVVAEALHYAHTQGVVHRDIKPGNLLLDRDGRPYVVDFGIALREQDLGRGALYIGTPPYMSPEQARGEGHRVDGRSDLFSLGVVLYELIVGRRPFHGDTLTELIEQVIKVEAKPPRQINDRIPKELERICLKALSKRTTDRYTTARDFAEDLQYFRHRLTQETPRVSTSLLPQEVVRWTPSRLRIPTDSDQEVLRIVPKGLRSFDAHDADFFLELLPGPRDRAGLPESIRFWKQRIEETAPEQTFQVGLVYGPSGCGKSSLVKAGLLPRLRSEVLAVYLEATAEETELRLLNGLRKCCPSLSEELDLKATMTALRRGVGIPAGRKVLLVLDQFEQWLHATKEEDNAELVQALRQCDGGRVQAVVLVRDDFWMAATRFMRALDFRLLDGQNSAAVDLFPVRHAEQVLTAFGRAFGAFPDGEPVEDRKRFVEQAIAGLAQEGKVIPVRLALFADMMKGKPWTPDSLKAVGGAEGVGIMFLEETFSAATAPPEHRYHQKAARGVLKALLPETGSDLKGHMRSASELLEASGYAGRPGDCDELLGILDAGVRLITPTDPEGKQADGDRNTPAVRPGEKYYQLTHDYLVPSVREWLTRKQKETRKGRAELLLADRAGVWSSRRENRQLPSLWQWLSIRWQTAKKNWTPPQREMMAKAGRVHAIRAGVLAVLLAAAAVTGLTIRERVREGRLAAEADGLVLQLLLANTSDVPAVIDDLDPYRRLADPKLRQAFAAADASARQKLHAALALLDVDDSKVEYLYVRLLDAQPDEVPVIRDFLATHQKRFRDRLWAVVERPEQGKESQRLRAAAALARYDSRSDRWKAAGPLVVNDLVSENPLFLGPWSELYRPVKRVLIEPLAAVFRDPRPERATERSLATTLLGDYAADDPVRLAELLLDADGKQFAAIYPKLRDHTEKVVPLLVGVLDETLPSADEQRETLAKRQANAAVALLRLGQPERVWPLLHHSADPRVRSYLIHRLFPLGADPAAIAQRLDEEPNVSARRALLLALGEFDEATFPAASRTSLLPQVQQMYRDDLDPGLHAASEWLLRQWEQDEWIQKVNAEWAKASRDRKRPEFPAKNSSVVGEAAALARWYVNGQGQTYVEVPGPVEFTMGSPLTERGRYDRETPHQRRIGRSFAIAAKAVTLAEYRRLTGDKHEIDEKFAYAPDVPVVLLNWYMAATYCNELSRAEGIPADQWCYEIKGEQEIRLKENYLSLTGYRLPTEAEMEYAIRAGAVTSHFYGETEELLGRYVWYLQNSNETLQRVGRKKPNDLGLFDAHGNSYTWCQQVFADYPSGQEVVEDVEGPLLIKSPASCILRGGSFLDLASVVRSSCRDDSVPTFRNVRIGVRPARTVR